MPRFNFISVVLLLAACAPAQVVANNPEILAEAEFQTRVAELRGTPAVPFPSPTVPPPLHLIPDIGNFEVILAEWPTFSPPDILLPYRPIAIKFPPAWGLTSTTIQEYSIYVLGDIRLLLFSTPANVQASSDEPLFFPFDETFACFRAAFLRNAEYAEPYQSPHMEVELIGYTNSDGNCITTLIDAPGVLALWTHEEAAYALIDQGPRHQNNSVFKFMLDTFQFLDQE
jgi:hypothetical protein